MATQVANNPPAKPLTKPPESFFDKHFAKIAFAVSTLAMLILSPLYFFLGTAAGLVISYFTEPKLKLQPTEKIITLPNAVFAIVGATAALLRMTPAGAVSGFIFNVIPLAASMAVGSTAYRAIKSDF